MRYRIDVYDKQLLVWRPTGLRFTTKYVAIREMDKMFFSKTKKSYRAIDAKQVVVARRLSITLALF